MDALGYGISVVTTFTVTVPSVPPGMAFWRSIFRDSTGVVHRSSWKASTILATAINGTVADGPGLLTLQAAPLPDFEEIDSQWTTEVAHAPLEGQSVSVAFQRGILVSFKVNVLDAPLAFWRAVFTGSNGQDTFSSWKAKLDTAAAIIDLTPSAGTLMIQASATNTSAGIVPTWNRSQALNPVNGRAVAMAFSTTTPPPVTVPNVVDLLEAAALAALAVAGLQGDAATKVADAKPAGTVLLQVPAAGAQVAAGTVVRLTVSSGPGGPVTVKVPQVVGLTVTDAVAQLIAANLGRVVAYVPDPAPVGTVLGQTPVSGTDVAPGTVVTLTVSSGSSGSGPLSGLPPWVPFAIAAGAVGVVAVATGVFGPTKQRSSRGASVPTGYLSPKALRRQARSAEKRARRIERRLTGR